MSTPAIYDPTDLPVLSSRFDGIVREMQSTLLRVARSSVIGLARDFSCSLVDADDRLVCSAEGLPVHVFGSGHLTASMRKHHPSIRPGDAFLHNDPYEGNTHAADHSLLIPIFVDGEHLFTAVAKAHQADIGNSVPTTYHPTARDVYEEGALIFPCVQIQRDFQDVEDIIRMCRRRIRVPDVWYGDFKAMLAAGRIAEKRIQELCHRFGKGRIAAFVTSWLDYSEERTAQAIKTLPGGQISASTQLDPYPGLPDGLVLTAHLDVDAEDGRVWVDLRDNPDCVPIGINLTEVTAKNSVVAATLMALNSRPADSEVPLNDGSFRCFEVAVRENCVAGIPRHPASCSLATGEVGVRLWAAVMAAFSDLGGGIGSAQASFGGAPYIAVVSGIDPERGEPYVTQLIAGTAGGPATAENDGWLSFIGFPAAGLLYRDSIEVLEQKYPIVVTRSEIRVDSEGAGRRRGAPGNICEYGPLRADMQSLYSFEGVLNLPIGVEGGFSPAGPSAHVAQPDGTMIAHPESVGAVTLSPGERIVSLSAGGGGYGNPSDRETSKVLRDVQEEWISISRANHAYGVVITGDWYRPESLSVDEEKTDELRRVRTEPV